MKILNALYFPETKLMQEGKRVFYYDNLRFILIFLVVQRHFLFRVDQPNFPIIQGLYMFFLWFLMPLFIFISGFYSKGTFKDHIFEIGRILNFFVLFIFLDQLIYFSQFISNGITKGFNKPYDFYHDMFNMPGAQWYMFACFVWFLIIPLLKIISPKITIPISFFLGIFCGYFSSIDSDFGLVKIFGFLPFFVVGYYVTNKHFEKILNAKISIRVIAILFLLVLAIYMVIQKDEVIPVIKRMLEVKDDYAHMWKGLYAYNHPILWAPLRAGYYLGVIIVSIAFLLVVPKRKTFFTAFGARTLQIYIFHCAVVRLIKPLGYYEFLNFFPKGISDLMLFISALVLSLLLSPKFLGVPFNKFAKLISKIKIRF